MSSSSSSSSSPSSSSSSSSLSPSVSIDQLPVDILLSILKSLDSFSTLRSALLTSRAFNNTWHQNEYGISQSIARTLIGSEPWKDAIRVMDYQASHLSTTEAPEAAPTAHTEPLRIGRSQAVQLVLNKRKIDECRDILTQTLFGPPYAPTGLDIMAPGNKRFDVAFYRCWWYSVKFFDRENKEEAFNPSDSYEMKTACLAHLESESVLDMEQLFHIFTNPCVINATLPNYPIMPWVVKNTVSQWRFSDVLWQLRLKAEEHWRKKFGLHIDAV